MEHVFAVDIANIPGASGLVRFTKWGDLVSVIVKNAFVLAGIIAFILIVFGGFSVIAGAGGGDTKRIEQGKQTLTYAVIGLILVIGSYSIIAILEKITGSNLFGR